jgi:hypothetical protein
MKTFNIKLFILLILAFYQLACGQHSISNENNERAKQVSDKKSETLKNQTQEFIDAQHNKNIEMLKKYIYAPQGLTNDNSTKEFVANYKDRNAKEFITLKEISDLAGMKFKETFERHNEIYTIKDKLYSLVQTHIILKIDNETCESIGYWLAISDDNGNNWGFLKGDSSFQKGFETYFEEASKKIKLPEKQPPSCKEN